MAELTGSYSAPVETVTFDGLLFDMDGTIIDSTAAIIKHWQAIGEELGVDPNVILATSHGRRSIDVLRFYDESKANWDYVRRMEGMLPQKYGNDAVEIPGARAMLNSLESVHAPWLIVTSGTKPLVLGWFGAMKLALPETMVTAEDVENGKPDPACYRLGRERLKLSTGKERICVFEDAPAGVRAGKAAGFKVVGLETTHSIAQLKGAGADWIVKDMRSIRLKEFDGEKGVVVLEIGNAFVEG